MLHSHSGFAKSQQSVVSKTRKKTARELLVYATFCAAQEGFYSLCFKPGTSDFVSYASARCGLGKNPEICSTREISRDGKVNCSKDVKFCEYFLRSVGE